MKISFLEMSRAYRSCLTEGVYSKQEDCPGIERIMAAVLSDLPAEEKQYIDNHAASCSMCSELLRKAQEISFGIDRYVDRYKILINQSGKGISHRKKGLWSFIIGYKPIVIPAALLFIILSGIFIFVPRNGLNTRTSRSNEQITLIRPVDTRVALADLQFVWKEVPNSKSYFIELFDETLNLVWRSSYCIKNEMIVPADIKDDLKPGLYYWIVNAIMNDDTSLKSDLKEFSIYQ